MSGTLAVAVRKGLIDALATLPDLTTAGSTGQIVDLEYAYKVYPPDREPRERLWTQNARMAHTPAALRATRQTRDERGSFLLRILVKGLALDPYTTSNRAVEIGHVVEDYVAVKANWPTVSTGISELLISGDAELVEAFNENGSLAELTYTLTWRARLT